MTNGEQTNKVVILSSAASGGGGVTPVSPAAARTEKAIKVLEHAIARLKTAEQGYVTDVIALHPIEDWLVQMDIKATRARYASTLDKMEDEILDTINYGALALSLIVEG